MGETIQLWETVKKNSPFAHFALKRTVSEAYQRAADVNWSICVYTGCSIAVALSHNLKHNSSQIIVSL